MQLVWAGGKAASTSQYIGYLRYVMLAAEGWATLQARRQLGGSDLCMA